MGIGQNEFAWMNQAIFDSLHHSAVVVVDITGLRPNCFVEMGYAFGNRQRVIFTAKEGTQFPFDVFALEAFLWKDSEDAKAQVDRFRKHWERQYQYAETRSTKRASERRTIFSVDIESSGPIPGEYSMLSIGACVVGNTKDSFYAELKPISKSLSPLLSKFLVLISTNFNVTDNDLKMQWKLFKHGSKGRGAL